MSLHNTSVATYGYLLGNKQLITVLLQGHALELDVVFRLDFPCNIPEEALENICALKVID